MSEILQRQGLGLNIVPGFVPVIIDARAFRPSYDRHGKLQLKEPRLLEHCGWHPGLVQQTVEDYPVAWQLFLSQARTIWQVGPKTVAEWSSFSVIVCTFFNFYLEFFR